MDELLSTFHLHDRLVKDNLSPQNIGINYESLRPIVEELRQKSYEYINLIIDSINTKNE